MVAGVARHWSVLTSAWAIDAEQARNKRHREQTEFLPAALEIIETPASPLARFGLWLLIGGVAVALLWAFIGKLDVVVTAPGRIIPADRVKIIQPTELGVVRAIHVRDGQHVRAGQLLLELDPTAAGADDAQARTGLMAAKIDRARSRALLSYLNGGDGAFIAPEGTPGELASIQHNLVATQIQEYEARRAILTRQRSEHVAEVQAAEAEIRKINETMPLFDQQIAAREELVRKGHFPRLRLYELQEQKIERTRNVDVQRAAAAKARASIAGVDAQLGQLRSELARSTVKELADAQDNSELRRNEIAKTDLRNRLMRMVSPVSGTVQQLSVHTLGGVVQSAETLLVVVPDDSQLLVEAKILNREAGFVREGQPVRLKIEAYPFTDYGTVPGLLESISRDAVEDEKLGLVYSARVRLDVDKARRNGLNLSPGMAITAEVMTGKRRIIRYLLSPISTRLHEAGRER
ncbi:MULTISPECIES: HlyD family type I secretion periplasmic adaptor subunit [unclassified Sphingomonas]|uniref:HlyD family type I secretion periplasmic adaptor subunit n=1 Tax=unclassified Sphingomonas TaxID=196159 RepID=UPI0009EB1B2E|nr:MULTISPECIES: HlyD family type I secretion periplasmic adaptor subunit [unclassified Sphingomonas]